MRQLIRKKSFHYSRIKAANPALDHRALNPAARNENFLVTLRQDRGTFKSGAKPQIISRAGFTMVEIVVMLAILTAISGLVLANFTGFNEGTALNRSARELALGIRKAQNMSLAVTRVGGQIPAGVGVYLSATGADSGKYFLFSDTGNLSFGPNPEEKIAGSEVRFERNVKIGQIKDQNNSSYTVANIIFTPPEATIGFSDSTGTPIPGEKLEIQLSVSGREQTKTLVIRTSGQVSIK